MIPEASSRIKLAFAISHVDEWQFFAMGVCDKQKHEHQWSSGRIHRCHRCDPGSIPG
jgi:hypothetical protein